MNPVIKQFQYGKHTVTLETGRIARQASGAVLVSMDDTVVLCTVVGAKKAKEGGASDDCDISAWKAEKVTFVLEVSFEVKKCVSSDADIWACS